MKNKAVTFTTFGNPKEVLEIQERELEPLQDKEILVNIQAAPINPADINFIQGNYGIRPELPAIPGVEGTGIVRESKSKNIKPGDVVIFIKRVGTWQQYVTCSEHDVIVIRENIDPLQLAMLKVNPLTAERLIKGFISLQQGDYLIQNAANSGVGQCTIQLAKHYGLHTINLVRREELLAKLKAIGADHVLLDDKTITEQVTHICGQQNLPKLACNAVGGDSALRLMDAICPAGMHVTYGAMSLKSLKVPNKFLIFKDITLKGLWVTNWLAETSYEEIESTYQQLASLVSAGKLQQEVDSTFCLDTIIDAVTRASEHERNGKVLIKTS